MGDTIFIAQVPVSRRKFRESNHCIRKLALLCFCDFVFKAFPLGCTKVRVITQMCVNPYRDDCSR